MVQYILFFMVLIFYNSINNYCFSLLDYLTKELGFDINNYNANSNKPNNNNSK
jgi:hypothetical protein